MVLDGNNLIGMVYWCLFRYKLLNKEFGDEEDGEKLLRCEW